MISDTVLLLSSNVSQHCIQISCCFKNFLTFLMGHFGNVVDEKKINIHGN